MKDVRFSPALHVLYARTHERPSVKKGGKKQQKKQERTSSVDNTVFHDERASFRKGLDVSDILSWGHFTPSQHIRTISQWGLRKSFHKEQEHFRVCCDRATSEHTISALKLYGWAWGFNHMTDQGQTLSKCFLEHSWNFVDKHWDKSSVFVESGRKAYSM